MRENYAQVPQQALNEAFMTLWKQAPGWMDQADFKNSLTFHGFEHFLSTYETSAAVFHHH